MIHLKKLIMSLALLLTAATGAWAESKPIGLNVEYAAGDEITSTTDVYVYYGDEPGSLKKMGVKITSTQPLKISWLGAHSFGINGNAAWYYLTDGDAIVGYAEDIPCFGESTGDATVVHVASGSGTLADPYVFAPGSAPAAPAGTTVDLTRGTGEKINEWTLTNGMPAGNVLLNVAYKDRATMALTYGGTAITTEANAVTAFKGFEQEFAEALTPAVQNIEPTFNSGTAQDVTTTLAADFTFKSSDANIIGFKSGETYAAEGTLDQMEFRALTTSPVTLTVTYKGTDDLESKSQALLVTIEKKTYTVSLKEGTEDADSWKGKKGDGNYVNLPITKLDEGDAVTLQYNGRLKVKGVKATSDAAPAAASLIVKPEVGQIIGSDGKNYAANATLPDGVTAVAMIAYVGTASDCDHGLAIALEDVSNEQLTWDNSGNNNDSKTAAEWCSAWNTSKAVTGGTWRLPSEKDWQYMFIGCGSNESYSAPTYDPVSKSYSGLKSKLTTAQGAALQSDFYWSSTEDNSNGVWGVVFDGSNAIFPMEAKTEDHKVRACLAF